MTAPQQTMSKTTLLFNKVFSHRKVVELAGGFSLIELMVVVAILGILSVVTLSSVELLRRENLRKANVELQSFLANTRTNALLNSTSCAININSPNPGIISVSEVGNPTSSRCSPTYGTLLRPELNLRQLGKDQSLQVTVNSCSGSDCTIGFSFRGTSLSSVDRIITLSSELTNNSRRCVLITTPVGFIKTGRQENGQSSCIFNSPT